MITIKNETTKLQKTDKVEDGTLTYGDLIMLCVNKQEQGGVTVEQMKKNFRISDVIEKGGDKFDFEDADFELVKQKVNAMSYPISHKDIIKFSEEINK